MWSNRTQHPRMWCLPCCAFIITCVALLLAWGHQIAMNLREPPQEMAKEKPQLNLGNPFLYVASK